LVIELNVLADQINLMILLVDDFDEYENLLSDYKQLMLMDFFEQDIK